MSHRILNHPGLYSNGLTTIPNCSTDSVQNGYFNCSRYASNQHTLAIRRVSLHILYGVLTALVVHFHLIIVLYHECILVVVLDDVLLNDIS